MEHYTAAGKGLRAMFQGEIAALLMLVLVFLPFVNVLVLLIPFVSFGLLIYGHFVSMWAHPAFKWAMAALAADIVLGVLQLVLGTSAPVQSILDILSLIAGFLRVFFVCTAAGALLEEKGDQVQAERAALIWRLYLITAAVGVACTLVGWLPVIGTLAKMASMVALVVEIIATVMLIVFYYKASRSLLEPPPGM